MKTARPPRDSGGDLRVVVAFPLFVLRERRYASRVTHHALKEGTASILLFLGARFLVVLRYKLSWVSVVMLFVSG